MPGPKSNEDFEKKVQKELNKNERAEQKEEIANIKRERAGFFDRHPLLDKIKNGVKNLFTGAAVRVFGGKEAWNKWRAETIANTVHEENIKHPNTYTENELTSKKSPYHYGQELVFKEGDKNVSGILIEAPVKDDKQYFTVAMQDGTQKTVSANEVMTRQTFDARNKMLPKEQRFELEKKEPPVPEVPKEEKQHSKQKTKPEPAQPNQPETKENPIKITDSIETAKVGDYVYYQDPNMKDPEIAQIQDVYGETAKIQPIKEGTQPVTTEIINLSGILEAQSNEFNTEQKINQQAEAPAAKEAEKIISEEAQPSAKKPEIEQNEKSSVKTPTYDIPDRGENAKVDNHVVYAYKGKYQEATVTAVNKKSVSIETNDGKEYTIKKADIPKTLFGYEEISSDKAMAQCVNEEKNTKFSSEFRKTYVQMTQPAEVKTAPVQGTKTGSKEKDSLDALIKDTLDQASEKVDFSPETQQKTWEKIQAKMTEQKQTTTPEQSAKFQSFDISKVQDITSGKDWQTPEEKAAEAKAAEEEAKVVLEAKPKPMVNKEQLLHVNLNKVQDVSSVIDDIDSLDDNSSISNDFPKESLQSQINNASFDLTQVETIETTEDLSKQDTEIGDDL